MVFNVICHVICSYLCNIRAMGIDFDVALKNFTVAVTCGADPAKMRHFCGFIHMFRADIP